MFAIMRVEKRKRSAVYGLQIETNRTVADHENGRDFASSDIDWERTHENQFFQGLHCYNWSEKITELIQSAGAKESKNSVVLLDGLYTASPEWFEGKSKAEIIDYFKDCLKFHSEHYGTLINATIHWDEKTPHLSCQSVPLIQGEKGVRLCAKDIMGGRSEYRSRQDLFYEQVAKKRGLERGERSDPADKKQHLSVQDYKKQQNELKIDAQERVLAQNKQEYTSIQKKLSESRTELDRAQERLFSIEEQVQIKTSQWKELTQRINNALEDQRSPLYDDFVKRFFCFMSDKLVTNGQTFKTVGEVFDQNYSAHIQKLGYEPEQEPELDTDGFEWGR